jgi:hypothetical protein
MGTRFSRRRLWQDLVQLAERLQGKTRPAYPRRRGSAATAWWAAQPGIYAIGIASLRGIGLFSPQCQGRTKSYA